MSDYRLPDGRIPVLVSSDARESLRREASEIADYLDRHPAVTADAVAEMLFRTRSARRYRSLAMVADRDELVCALRAIASDQPHSAVVTGSRPASARRVGFVFPGQGSQRPGMGKLYYAHSQPFREAVDASEETFQRLFGISPLGYLLHDDGEIDDDVRIVQPALFMQMIGLSAMWRAAGVEPAATIGHSQGEIAAASVSGIISHADGVRVVTLRADLVDTLCRAQGLHGRYSMAVLGMDRDRCDSLLARNSGWSELSVINSAHVLAISGENDVVAEVVAQLTAEGVFAKAIRVAYPAHTSIVSRFRHEMDESLANNLEAQTFASSQVDCIGATLGEAITPDLPVSDYWFWNLRNKVRFDLAIADAAARGIDTYIEVAEHPALMLAIQETLSGVEQRREFDVIGTSRRTAEGLDEFTRNLATVAVHDIGFRWDALRDKTSDCPPALPLLDFPNTQTNPRTMWADFLAPSDVEALDEPTGAAARLLEVWNRLERRKLVPPRSIGVVDHSGRCADLVAAICTAAPRMGAKAVELTADAADIDTVLILVPDSGGAPIEATAQFLAEGSWLPDLTGVEACWLVTSGAETVVGDDIPDRFHAAAQAGFRCLAAEHVGVAFRHLDLQPDAAPADAAKALVNAVHAAGEPELAVRESKLFAKRLVVDDTDIAVPAPASELVIVGGTGTLGLEFCEHAARAGARRVTVLSRSGGSDAAQERIRGIRERTDSEIVLRTCDVTVDDEVRTLAAEFTDTPIDLLIHASVDYAASTAQASTETVRRAAAAKVGALDSLVRHLPIAENGRVVLCSSLSASIGGRGHAVYSAVNRMLDVAAVEYRADGIDCVSVQWGLWHATGSGDAEAEAQIAGTGLEPMAPEDAIAAGFAPTNGNLIVAAADWARVSEIYEVFGFDPLFAELPKDAPQPQAPVEERPVEPAPVPAPDTGGPAPDTAERLRFALRTVMGMDAAESIDGAVPLVALGLDSLQALDFRKRVQADLERDLPVTAILGGASLDEVVSLIGR